ncbi:Pkinase-domain-containing protein [Dendrothele bispora CBS 962.96]|uniref:non-specific serine/threonine protein kinase n=1 Tax=Dendrothele bispora (strain CBS 962.96) TaxID=1314807 RepID=A0A4S8MIU5_DENBC|nr:Pkinase-domain-containing protein [Dendrothele bispora CBS 962.96]
MSTSLQIPSPDLSPGPSRHHHSVQPPSSSRPVSVNVHSSPPSATSPPARKQRASHQVVSSTQSHQVSSNNHSRGQEDSSPPYTDVYNHPAAVAYASAHPRRTIPKFGPYLLLQTLGEGEFGKVKLGLHCQWGEEVAVKLIRRGNVDSAVRMSKVEREIEVLRTLKHPNIVRLYDVIETDKYIGIIIEYASGGELFDHILAHRYLRERDAAKLFSQLISGVWYIHQKKIVHRDLKLENLLLDRHRNVIITDFGFANRFEHRADDLMQTSCGSPCYAAPELVISEGLYVGSAVDIWSCGVILYAMLAGYLPFDDDPANPDGDNINLLYKYIVNTPLSFPDYISEQARDLLSMMLVPDPSRRASLENIMRHPWLAAYQVDPTDPKSGLPTAFGKTVDELEKAAMDQHHQKRLAYQRQMRAGAGNPNSNANPSPSDRRAQSHRPEMLGSASAMAAPGGGAGSRSASMEPALYETPAAHTSSPSGASKKSKYDNMDDDPFAAPGVAMIDSAGGGLETPSKKTATRPHTVQVEYDSPQPRRERKEKEKEREKERSEATETDRERTSRRHREKSRSPTRGHAAQASSSHVQSNGSPPSATASSHRRGESQGSPAQKPLPPSPAVPVSAAPSSPRKDRKEREREATTPSRSSTLHSASAVNAAGVKETPSIILAGPPDTPIRFATSAGGDGTGARKTITPSSSTHSASVSHKKDVTGTASVESSFATEGGLLSPTDGTSGTASSAASTNSSTSPNSGSPSASAKKSRRNTLTVMVEPISRTIKNRTRGRNASAVAPSSGLEGEKYVEVEKPTDMGPRSAVLPTQQGVLPGSGGMDSAGPGGVNNSGFATPGGRGPGLQASTNKAVKVMQWFRNKSKGRDSVGYGMGGGTSASEEEEKEKEGDAAGARSETPTQSRYRKKNATSSSTINQATGANGDGLSAAPTTPSTAGKKSSSNRISGIVHPHRTPSSATDTSTPSFVTRFRNSVTVGGATVRGDRDRHHGSSGGGEGEKSPVSALRIHHGPLDQDTITSIPPPEVMKKVREVLVGMGVEIQVEGDYKYKCVRPKKKRSGTKDQTGGQSAASAGNVGGNSGFGGGNGLAAFAMTGSAASNGVDKRGLPMPSHSTFSGSGNTMLRMLMRRNSSQVSTSTSGQGYEDESFSSLNNSVFVAEPGTIGQETLYGDPPEDLRDEVKFSVELTRIDRLADTYSLDVRRMKGNLRSYKFLYDTIRQRAELR